MPMFTKKPVTIEARLFEGGAEQATPLVTWMLDGDVTASWHEAHDAWESEDGSQGYPGRPEGIEITTLEGIMRADVGDWIVRGVRGEFYPVKPGIFAESYDPAE